MFKSYPILSRFLLFVVLPVAAALIACFVYLRGSLPAAGGRVIKAGVSQPVEITRDENGVAVINARTDRDAFFAIGFAHAQDRMWQLELERRTAAGRLSEIFGRDTVPQDAWMRTLGLYEAAEQSWSRLSPEARDSLTAYAAGVNAWIAQDNVLPPEFIALGVRPEPWREVDSLAWSKVFALNLSNNMWNETSNLIASQYLSREQMVDLLGYSQSDLSAAAGGVMSEKAAAELLSFREGLEGGLKIGGRYVGSNAWVVSGRLMQGGQAALANDPHLGVQMPSPWYVARLKGDRLNVSGMTLVGLPVVIFGQNGDIAWGGASMMADVQDLYIEQPNPADPSQYRHGDGWAGFQMRSEDINIGADFPASFRAPVKPVRIQLRRTLNGPVISNVVGAFDQPVALRWTALDPDDASYESFFRVNYARDWDTFKDSFQTYVAPALNMLYADRSNNIGSLGVGRIPVRAKGEGRLPVPAWTNEYSWTGYIPFKDWPQRFNPEEGYIVSANDKPVGPDYPYFISADFAPPNRARRIEQLLREKVSAGEPIALEHFGRMQGDTVDLSVRGLLDYLKRVPPSGPEQRKALGYLQELGREHVARKSGGRHLLRLDSPPARGVILDGAEGLVEQAEAERRDGEDGVRHVVRANPARRHRAPVNVVRRGRRLVRPAAEPLARRGHRRAEEAARLRHGLVALGRHPPHPLRAHAVQRGDVALLRLRAHSPERRLHRHDKRGERRLREGRGLRPDLQRRLPADHPGQRAFDASHVHELHGAVRQRAERALRRHGQAVP